MQEIGSPQDHLGDDFYLDILGQQPALNSFYTQICFCFPTSNASSDASIVEALKKGLERLSEAFPWVAGQVVNEGAGDGTTGVYRIKACEKSPRLLVNDLRSTPSIPTMDDLKQANFPFSMLDESVLSPCLTFTFPPKIKTGGDPVPVLLTQVNFIVGGVLLNFIGQHATMDVAGQGHVIDLLSRACNGEAFTSEELSSGNLRRRHIIPTFDKPYEPGAELAYQIAQQPSQPEQASNGAQGVDPTPTRPVACHWTYFSFTPSSLRDLKSLATETLTISDYVSTNDALGAFLWQSITRARLPRLSTSAETTFARTVNVRRYLGIPKTYAGLVQNMTYHTLPAQKLAHELLGSIASDLRLAVDPRTSDLGERSRALATFLERSPDKNAINMTGILISSATVMMSSWAHLDSYGLDFNLGLGKPEAVRIPRFIPIEGMVYLLPKEADGTIVAGVCLREQDLENLRADKKFSRHAAYIG